MTRQLEAARQATAGRPHDDTVTVVRQDGADGETDSGQRHRPAWWRTRRGQLAVAGPAAVVLGVTGYLVLAPGGPSGQGGPGPAHSVGPIGDSCLVGSWRDNGGLASTTYNGISVAMSGGGGDADHIAASGTDTDVYGPDALPRYGTYNGSTLEQELQGEEIVTLRANPHKHQLTAVYHGWSVGSTNRYLYQGSTSNGVFNKPNTTPVTYGYRCAATTLTWLYQGLVHDTEARISTTP